ncbi:MAG: hypothetical protein JXD19_11050, partial [Deltaproteobacteria bacterium]|nr:hypothetical protein [Deltaproteobacteria bacterium]
MKKDGCADRCYGRVAVGIVVFVAIFLSVIQALHALESVFPLTVGKKWIYAYEYREETECSLYDFPPYNEEGVIYLEVISNRLQAGTDVYTVRKTIKSDQGVVGTYAVDLFENSEGLKESPSGSVIVHYRQP